MVNCGNWTATSPESKGSALTCSEVLSNWSSLEALLYAYCNSPREVYIFGQNGNTITITDSDLAYTATEFTARVKVYYNGSLQYNNELSGQVDGYTITIDGDVVTFTLPWTPTGTPGTPGVEDFLIQ